MGKNSWVHVITLLHPPWPHWATQSILAICPTSNVEWIVTTTNFASHLYNKTLLMTLDIRIAKTKLNEYENRQRHSHAANGGLLLTVRTCWESYVSKAEPDYVMLVICLHSPVDATATPSSLASFKSRMVDLSGATLLMLSRKRGG